MKLKQVNKILNITCTKFNKRIIGNLEIKSNGIYIWYFLHIFQYLYPKQKIIIICRDIDTSDALDKEEICMNLLRID